MKMDPWILFMRLLNMRITTFWLYFRILLQMYAFYNTFISYRTLFVLYSSLLWYRVIMLNAMIKTMPTKRTILLYSEQVIAMKILRNFERLLLSASLTAIFLLYIILANGFIVGIEKNIPTLAIMSTGSWIFCTIALLIIFNSGSALTGKSSHINVNWKNVAARENGRKKRLMDRTLKALSKITMPVGCASIVDKDMKLNYAENVMLYVMDSLVSRKSGHTGT